MKTIIKILVIILIVPLLGRCKEDTDISPAVTIPDNNFLNALIEKGVDKNSDGIISTHETAELTALEVISLHISSLKGIEAFVNLDTLNCSHNQLTSLDVSNNHKLVGLYCGDNLLSNLDVSNNPKLFDFVCSENQLASLDVSHNLALSTLGCENNLLNDLDVSKNLAITLLICKGNLLTSLNLYNNSAINLLNLQNMPSLYKVCVWTIPFPPSGVTADIDGSPNVYFTMNCN